MHILEQIRPERSSEPYSYDINTIRAVAQVNKHCFKLAEPILYRSVRLQIWCISDEQLLRRQQVLVRKLEISPRLYSYIRHLSLTFVTSDSSVMLKTLAQCTKLAILTLDGYLTPKNHKPLLRELIMSSNLRELRLAKDCAVFVLGILLVDGAPSNLKVLKVDNSESQLAPFVLPPSTAHSNIEELVILTNFWPDLSVLTLMRWSRQIRVFKYSINHEFYSYYSPPGDHFQLTQRMPPLQQLLDIQSDTLEHIDIDRDSIDAWNTNESMIDLSLYANLRWLKVHDRNILSATSPERVCASLPRDLACLEIGIPCEEQIAMDVEERVERVTTWLETFFTIRAGTMPDHRLKRIHVRYCFDDRAISHCPITGYIHDEPWPLEMLEGVISALKRFDVSVTWPEPYISKSAWQLMIKDQTVPNYEYATTKADRLTIVPATDEEIEYHYDSGFYSHRWGK